MTEEHRSDGRSIDEILAEARAELDKTPDEPQQAAEPGTPEPDDFTPDFGHTFDDYGEFEEPQPEEELPPEPPRKRHKRIVPLFVKIILYVVIVTVASMIEKETASAKESSTIASVIYNRLCDPANYPYLNIDATIVYALGGIDGALTYEDTQIDSPYNTYNRTGLPAGPISNPGLSSISAALNPADTSYYYYALDDSTGLHHFSESYDEHQAFLAGQNDA